MMKRWKVVYTVLILSVIFTLSSPVRTRAAGNIVPAAVRCGVGGRGSASGYVNVSMEGAHYIKNLKFSSSQIKGKINRTKAKAYDLYISDISFYAKKAGKYKMTFDVYTVNGKKYRSCSVKIYAVKDYYTITNVGAMVKSVSIDGKKTRCESPAAYSMVASGYIWTEKASGKVRFELRKGYQIKKIKVLKVDQEGKVHRSTIKNGSRITFSNCGEETPAPGEGDYRSTKNQAAYTYVYITYYDAYLKKSGKLSLWICRPAKKWYNTENSQLDLPMIF